MSRLTKAISVHRETIRERRERAQAYEHATSPERNELIGLTQRQGRFASQA